MAPSLCPSTAELRSFCDGRLPLHALETISEHLDQCASCSAALGASESDTLVVDLRDVVRSAGFSTDEKSRAHSVAERLTERTGTWPPDPKQVALPSPPSALGRLGQYDLLEKLGEGGMGVVYKARHARMDRIVALKVLTGSRHGGSAAAARFAREARALAKLQHPNIVRAEYSDETDGTPYLVMEYVEGTDLASWVRTHGPLSAEEAISYLRQAAAGLQHAHENGLVHRDIKPSNLFRTPDGQIKLLDLGLARFKEDSVSEEVTATGQVLGTLDYMAPEQWEDTRAVDIRADLYSLGCTFYHLLTGAAPFATPAYQTSGAKMRAHLDAPPPVIHFSRPELPAFVGVLLDRLLAKRPADRFATPADLIAVLDNPATLTEVNVAPAPEKAVRKEMDRRWLWIAAMVLGMAFIFTLVAFLSRPGWRKVLDVSHGTTTTSRGTIPQPATPTSAEKLQIDALQVRHFRGIAGNASQAAALGVIGENSRSAVFDDDVRVAARFSDTAHAYLIALNTDGSAQLLWPVDKDTPPPTRASLEYPVDPKRMFAVNDNPQGGTQAFVLIASRQPLPAFAEWEAKNGKPQWSSFPTSGIWEFDGRVFSTLPRTRGIERPREVFDANPMAAGISLLGATPTAGLSGVPWSVFYAGPPQPLVDVADFYRSRPGVEAVQIVSFHVKPKP